MERHRPVTLTASIVVVLLVVGGVWWFSGARNDDRSLRRIPGVGPWVTVEVLNGTTVDGLAREVTKRLRSQGIDVVFFGTADESDLDSTHVIARRQDLAAARRVRKVLGVGTISDEAELGLLLDVTVLLGRDAAPRSRLNP